MGEVWLAQDTLLDRPVAIKYLMAPDSSFHRDFFLSEARSLARLQHPNITLIYDAVFNESQQQFHLIMEYVDGDTLNDFIKKEDNKLPLSATLDIAIGVAQALEYAHKREIVHRDIKPSNVMISNGKAKLTDFGLADLMSALTEGSDEIVGTVDYMPPEQILANPMDGRADLYSLGVMLYEMVTGQTPFSHHEMVDNIIAAHLNEAPVSPREFAPNIPIALEYAILHLLEKEQENRYQSAGELLKALNSLQARQQVSQSHMNLLALDAGPIVGRADALQQLNDIWDQVRDQHKPHLVVLQGDMGIGKTRLAVEFIGQKVVDQGFIAVAGRSDEFNLPYDPFGEILSTIINRQLTPPIPQAKLMYLLMQIPELARLIHLPSTEVPPPAQNQDPSQVHWQFYSAVLSVFTQLEKAVIFIEDATTLDKASLDLLRFILNRKQLPLMFVTACRNQNKEAWHEIISTHEKTSIDLEPLSTTQIAEYVTEWATKTVPKSVIEVIETRSQGNPLQVEIAINQLHKDGLLYKDRTKPLTESRSAKPVKPAKQKDTLIMPQSVTGLFEERLAQLSEESHKRLIMAALLKDGHEFDFDTWVKLLGGESQLEIAQQVIDEAQEKRVVYQVSDSLYAFRPVEMGKALIGELSTENRRSLHLVIADILVEKQVSPILIAYHYEQAGLVIEAASTLKAAGDNAIETFAVDSAIEYYNRSVELEASGSVYKTLGKLYHQIGRWKDSANSYREALLLAEKANDTTNQATILNQLSFTLWMHDQYREAYKQAMVALKLPGAPATQQAISQSHLGMISWLMGQLSDAETWCLKAVDILRNAEDQASLAAAYSRLGLVYFSQGRFSESETVTNSALGLRKSLNDPWGEAFCLNNLAKVAIDRGDFDKALTLLKSAEELFKKVNSLDGLMVIYTNQGRTYLHRGDAATALPHFTKAMRLAQEIGKWGTYGLSEIYLLTGQASLRLGKISPAKGAVSDALRFVQKTGNREYIAVAQATLAEIHAAQGENIEAEEMYRKALNLFEEIGNRAGLLRTRLSYARFLDQRGEQSGAASLRSETLTQAKEIELYLPVN